MSKFKKIDLKTSKTIPVALRKTKSDISSLGSPFDPDNSFTEFLSSLPGCLKAGDLIEVAHKIALAKTQEKNIIWMMGAHPIKVGLSDIICDLISSGHVSHLALNGACVIHDIEMAFFGRTSEDVSETLADGSFGMVSETPNLIFEAAAIAKNEGLGLGEGMGRFISKKSPEFGNHSILGACYKNDIPATVHIAIGTDTICQHPGYDGALFGKLSHDDFLIFSESVGKLSKGIVINVGSAVILPEVFLKALTVARNIYGAIGNFSAVNFDMIQHYRPNTNVITRPVSGSGKGYSLTGHHEIMIPLLAAAIKDKYREILGRK
jgi:hypothetical protein